MYGRTRRRQCIQHGEVVHTSSLRRRFAIIATGRTTAALQTATNETLMAVSEWLKEKGLKLLINKTEAVILTTKRGYDQPEFMLNGINIDIKEQISYLRLEVNRVLSFRKHIKKRQQCSTYCI